MQHRGVEFALDNHVGIIETLINVAFFEEEMFGNVGRLLFCRLND